MKTETLQPQQVEIETDHYSQQESTPENDPFFYGFRVVRDVQPDGSTRYRDVPLTQADFLDPQPGDHFTLSTIHIKLVCSLHTRFYHHYTDHPNKDMIGVFGKLKMCWGIPGEKEPMPDVAIVTNLKLPQYNRRTFDVQVEGARPCLIVEVMSPLFPGDDTIKVDLYQRMGITEYIIINPHCEDDRPTELIGYRLEKGQYQPIHPDQQGRLLSQTTNLWFALNESTYDVVLTNALSGKRLLTMKEVTDASQEAQARLAAERQRTALFLQRAETAEAEIARLRALFENQP